MECGMMKTTLLGLALSGDDSRADKVSKGGRVAYEVFHAEPSHELFQFTEPAEYLQQSGSLELGPDGGNDGAEVLIANYLLGPSNCIASTEYFSVCCVNQCEALTSEIEAKVLAPVSQPEKLLDA